jgi:flagellar protein FlaI
MDIPKVLIAYTLDVIILQLKLNIQGRSIRRIMQISEIAGLDNDTGDILLNDVFSWDPINDKHVFSGRSVLFEKYGQRYGESTDQIMYELNKRKTTMEWLVKNNIHKHKDVANTLKEFYANPEKFYEEKRMTF